MSAQEGTEQSKTVGESRNAAVTFRMMEIQDTPEAARIEAASSQEPWSQKSYEDALLNENACYVVAELEGRVVGCCGLWQSFEDADICNVVVEKSCRKRGIALEMLEFLMEMGKQRGAAHFTLEVRSSNAAAIGLYEKLGFRTEGVRKGFYQNPKEDALIMWKRSLVH